jgi:hypothetical protein
VTDKNMTLIPLLNVDATKGAVKESLLQSKEMFGMVPSALQLLANSPHQFETQLRNIKYYAKHPNLSNKLLAMVRMMLAHTHHCPYCVDLNGNMLMQMG